MTAELFYIPKRSTPFVFYERAFDSTWKFWLRYHIDTHVCNEYLMLLRCFPRPSAPDVLLFEFFRIKTQTKLYVQETELTNFKWHLSHEDGKVIERIRVDYYKWNLYPLA